MADVFLSYARVDTEFVRSLHDALVSEGKEAWVDWRDIPPSFDWHEQIQAGIDAADSFVFVVTPASLSSSECAYELDYANTHGKRIVPVVRQPARDGQVIPPPLADPQWIFIRPGDDFGVGVRHLITALETDAERVRQHSTVLVAARRWEREGRERSYLLRGSMLEAAEELLTEPEQRPALTPLQREYIDASRHAAARRQRLLLVTVSAGLVVALALAAGALVQRNNAVNQRREALSLGLASAATTNLAQDPQLSVLLAQQAVAQRDTPQAEDALRQAVGDVQLVGSFVGHRGPVTSVAFDPAGDLLVTASEDGTARVWEVDSGAPVSVLHGGRSGMASAVFDPSGQIVLGVGDDGMVRLWTARTGSLLHALRAAPGPGAFAQYARHGAAVVTAGPAGPLRLWDASTGRLDRMTRVGGSTLTSLAVSPDGKRAAVSDAAGAVRIWNLGTGRLGTVSRGQTANEVKFSPDGRLLAVAGANGVTTLETPAGKVQARLGAGLPPFGGISFGDVDTLTFSPNGRYLAAAIAQPGLFRVFQASDGQLISTLRGQAGVSRVVFRNDSRFVITTGSSTPLVWDAITGEQVAVLAGHSGASTDAAFAPDGRVVATASEDGTVRLWDATSGRLTDLLPQPSLLSASMSRAGLLLTTGTGEATVWDSHTGRRLTTIRAPAPIVDATLSPDGRRLAVETANAVQVEDAIGGAAVPMSGGGAPQTSGQGPEGGPGGAGPTNRAGLPPQRVIAFSPDGRRLLASARDGTLRLWDPGSGRVAVTLQGRPGQVRQAGFSADGTRVLAVGLDGVARLWLASTGRQLAALPASAAVSRAALSPDNRRLLTASMGGGPNGLQGVRGGPAGPGRSGGRGTSGRGRADRGPSSPAPGGAPTSTGYARLWDAATARRLATLTAAGEVSRVAFSHDGRRFVTGGNDGVVRVWDTSRRTVVATLSGHAGGIGLAVFSPDDRLVLSTSIDQTARLWDPSTGAQLAILRGAAGGVSSAQFAPDGSSVLTTSDDNFVRLYACPLCGSIADVLAASRRLVTQRLTPAQRQRYLAGV